MILGESEYTSLELRESLKLIQADVDILLIEINKIVEELEQSKYSLDEFNEFDVKFISFEERYNNANFNERKAMLNQVIEKIYISKKTIEIEYKKSIIIYKENS